MSSKNSIHSALNRRLSITFSRFLIVLILVLSFASYFWQPTTTESWILDIVSRTCLLFWAGVLAHEAVHGHLGKSRRSNQWWGRLAVVPTAVNFEIFRLTHLQHHAHTNEADKDPDYYLNVSPRVLLPIRAIALPHHWLTWLLKQGRLNRKAKTEYALTYLAYAVIYGGLAWICGWERVLLGLLGSAAANSVILWFFVGTRAHAGFSTGKPEERTHNYYGALAYWLTLGLSLHREHHMRPHLSWLEMQSLIPKGSWWQCLSFQRQIHISHPNN